MICLKGAFILLFAAIFVAEAQKPAVFLPKEIADALRTKATGCAKEVNGDMEDIVEQIYAWDIKNHDQVRDFLACIYRTDPNSDKFEPLKVVRLLGDFDKKNEVIKIMDDCYTDALRINPDDTLMVFEGCFMKTTPVIIKF